mmetsp:Transcript_8159/g.11863  ORF Transcript_8159/g.11863 Transcript_8159/m.11863 type:complete len:347 (-) Transcript_8159:47-1087(-)
MYYRYCQGQVVVVIQEKEFDDDDDAGSWIDICSSNDELSDDSSVEYELREYDNVVKMKNTITPNDQQQHTISEKVARLISWIIKLCILLAVPLFIAAMCPPSLFPSNNNSNSISEASIYVPGVGFSGFWFSLGRLQSLPDPTSNEYYCFSAGCLGSVAVLNQFSVEEVACLAQSAQVAWNEGNISRYEVVSHFVDGLVYRRTTTAVGDGCLKQAAVLESNNYTSVRHINNNSNSNNNNSHPSKSFLSKLNILTTTRYMRSSMRTPTDLADLREMLIQTTWIPLATGDQLYHKDHMDGGFSIWEHPPCKKSVTLPLYDTKLLFNSLNVNMGIGDAYRLWEKGLAYGL